MQYGLRIFEVYVLNIISSFKASKSLCSFRCSETKINEPANKHKHWSTTIFQYVRFQNYNRYPLLNFG